MMCTFLVCFKNNFSVKNSGVQKVIQKVKTSDLPYGVALKIIPYSTQTVLNAIGCFAVNGSEDAPTEITSVLPDLAGFKVCLTSLHDLSLCSVIFQYIFYPCYLMDVACCCFL